MGLLVLRMYKTATFLQLATSHNDYTFYDCAWGFPQVAHVAVARVMLRYFMRALVWLPGSTSLRSG